MILIFLGFSNLGEVKKVGFCTPVIPGLDTRQQYVLGGRVTYRVKYL